MDEITRRARQVPGVDHAITIGGLSALDNTASLANAGMVYLVLKDWGERGKAEGLRSIYQNLSRSLASVQEAATLVLIPPPIQGLGMSGGFQLQVELADGTFDFTRLQQ